MIRICLALAMLLLTGAVMAADEPPHQILVEDGDIQIRLYEPQILAEVEVAGRMSSASGRGFGPLANYIFGGNQSRDGASQDIAMTTPVTQTRSQEIAMTTPVTQSAAGHDRWRVAFIMPAEWTMETLPVPDDPRVDIRELPARMMATIRFSGGPNARRFMRHETELRAWLDMNEMEIIGEPVYARYDPPWVPTPFRRNEVMIEIANPQS
ncbi:MAG: heme-binding protein [Alphaproteobacteria bacterium]|nr:heme-binding protein [Alphaproteobacteria bacterium]